MEMSSLTPRSVESIRKTYEYKPPRPSSIWSNLKWDKNIIYNWIPILKWLQTYKLKEYLLPDIIAGITVAILQIPQAVAFARLAFQPPVVGLYMAAFPLFIYMFLATSPHLSIGMFAVLIQMVGDIVSKIAITDEQLQNGTIGYSAMQVGAASCFTVGVWQFLLGFFQAGSLWSVFSNVLISAFTCGASLHIINIQLLLIFGITLPKLPALLKLPLFYYNLVIKITETNLITFAVGLVTIISLYLCIEFIRPLVAKKSKIPVPFELIFIAVGTGVSALLDLKETYDVEVVGHIPSALPAPQLPAFPLVPYIAIDCLVIAILMSAVNIAIASTFAKKGKYEISENQEMRAVGAANVFGSLFFCLPACGSLSRSSLQFTVGGKTQLTHGICGLTVLLMLVLVGFLLENAPLSVLAGVIIVSLKNMLLQCKEFPDIWRKSTEEGIVWLGTFLGVLFLDVGYGLLLGVTLSIIFMTASSLKTDVQVLESLAVSKNFVDTKFYSDTMKDPNILVLKISGGLNVQNFKSVFKKINKMVEDFSIKDNAIKEKFVVLDFKAVPYIDGSVVKDLNKFLSSNVCCLICCCCSSVYDTLENCDLFGSFSKSKVVFTLSDAIEYIHKQM